MKLPNDSVVHILAQINDERARQEQLKAQGKFTFTCADPQVNNTERLAVLAEEFGEVAREVTEQIIVLHKLEKEFVESGQRSTIDHVIKAQNARMRKELIQVAAVCVAWIEGLDATEVDDRPRVNIPSIYGKLAGRVQRVHPTQESFLIKEVETSAFPLWGVWCITVDKWVKVGIAGPEDWTTTVKAYAEKCAQEWNDSEAGRRLGHKYEVRPYAPNKENLFKCNLPDCTHPPECACRDGLVECSHFQASIRGR